MASRTSQLRSYLIISLILLQKSHLLHYLLVLQARKLLPTVGSDTGGNSTEKLMRVVSRVNESGICKTQSTVVGN